MACLWVHGKQVVLTENLRKNRKTELEGVPDPYSVSRIDYITQKKLQAQLCRLAGAGLGAVCKLYFTSNKIKFSGNLGAPGPQICCQIIIVSPREESSCICSL